MLYGVDSLNPPSRATAQALWDHGWRWSIVYVGGPRAAAGHQGWPNAAIKVLAEVGFVFLPVFVGRTFPYDQPMAFNYLQGLADGDNANVLTGACGFDSTTPLALDAEYGDWQNAPGFTEYLRGFGERVNAAGHKLCLYSDTETLNQYGPDLVDLKWGAAYKKVSLDPTRQGPPVGRFDPAEPPPWSAWQWALGPTFDLNSAVDDFPFAHYQSPP